MKEEEEREQGRESWMKYYRPHKIHTPLDVFSQGAIFRTCRLIQIFETGVCVCSHCVDSLRLNEATDINQSITLYVDYIKQIKSNSWRYNHVCEGEEYHDVKKEKKKYSFLHDLFLFESGVRIRSLSKRVFCMFEILPSGGAVIIGFP